MKASQTMEDNLQKVLVDLVELHVQGKQAHWSVVGPNFRDLHLQLDEIIDAARGFSDEVAERMRALHGMPDGRSETVSASTTLPKYPDDEVITTDVVNLVVERLEATAKTMRDVHDEIDEEDPATADLLHAIILRLEQYAWLVNAENQRPRKRGTTTESTE